MDELEDQLSTQMDETIKNFTVKFAEKQDVRRVLKNMDRQVKLLRESVFGQTPAQVF